ncbi:F-type H+-transporting ATPase subunit gamma [Granulicella pectinivorans]|jgi:F-type H+-transporting ATPase subunit gamma|uniref:ATP synthase gamma chain n=1 Tax=Granulicella pectinivorans TaxID=474950 RepID=A0A1I6MP08_9BACT|nr:FoF1 ATP synthase subunit gamma [Granulicella pectinivorans]SFS17443.1 F-type H+-transporting ATPase subunit gamma [Granulicella pectinivorans]
MANVLDLRRRIRSVKNTRQITKAMKMVSAAKLRRAQERAMQARPYAQMLTNVLESLVRRTDLYNAQTGEIVHPLLAEREEKNVLLLVIAGDKGFAGGFNSNIGKAAQKFFLERTAAGQNVDLEPIGKKAVGFYKKRFPAANYEKTEEHYDNELSTHYETIRHRVEQIEVTGEHLDLLGKTEFDVVTKLAHSIIERYERTEIDAVYLVYNEFKSVIQQRVVVEKLLPIRKLGSHEITAAENMSEEQRDAAAKSAASEGISVNEPEESVMEKEAKKFGNADVDYIFDQSPEQLFKHLMPRYVATQIFHALLESVAAEHAARMTATDAATKNAGDLIDSLSLTMNRVRQAAITKEIIEIVSGAAAL